MSLNDGKAPEDFAQLIEIMTKRKEVIRSKLSKHLNFVENCLTYMLKLRAVLTQKINAKYSAENPCPNNLALALFLLDRNILYIYSSYSLFLKSLVDPAKEHERVLLESALVNYSLAHGKFAMVYYEKVLPLLNQTFDKIQEGKVDSELLAMHDKWRESCRAGTTIARLADELYLKTDKKKAENVECERLKIYESGLSLSSHANIINLGANTEIKIDNLEKELATFSSMLMFYLISLAEIFHDFIVTDARAYEEFSKITDDGLTVVEGRLIPLPNSSQFTLKFKLREKGG